MADGSPHPSQPLEITAALPPSDPNLDTQTLLEDSKLSSGQEKPSLAATIVNEVIKDSPLSQSALPTSIRSDLDGVGSTPVVTHFEPAINSVSSSEESPIASGIVSSIRPAVASQETPQPDPTPLHADATNNASITKLRSALPGPDLPQENAGDDQDVHMTDGTFGASPSPKPRNDNDVPPWLTSKIVYFRGVAEDAAWQDLITHLVEFEKSGPPNGVSFIVLSLIVNLV